MKASLSVAYLYEDGHLVEVYESTSYLKGRRVGSVKYVEIHEKFAERGPKGRIILHFGGLGFLPALKGGRVEASEATVEAGSALTKARGIAVGHVGWHTAAGRYAGVNQFPGLISGGMEYQPEVGETFTEVADLREWSDYPVVKVVRSKNGAGT